MTRHAPKYYVPPQTTGNAQSWAGEAHPVAALICAIGFFMHLLLSGPVLNILGYNYGSENAGMLSEAGGALTKIHPGSYFIIVSMLVLLFSRRNPVEQVMRIAREQTAFFSFLTVYVVIFVYWMIRGPRGIGMILDVHIVMPICAIVFSYAPRNWYRTIVYLFAGFAVANSLVGLCESATHLRLFPFDEDWEVLKQDYFRASAFMGHPLTNVSFTVVALFVLLGVRMPAPLKATILLIMLSSLVAFGGRSGLISCVVGLVILGATQTAHYLATRRMTVLRLTLMLFAILIVPVVCTGLLYVTLHSGMGARLMAYSSFQDESASVRVLAFKVIDYMSPSDIIFGLDGQRIAELGYRAGVSDPTSDIENPWILLFMFFGAIMFTLWMAGWLGCMWRLMAGADLALKLAVVEYFVVSSTSNSFGRKDPVYMILAGIVVCAKRLDEIQKAEQQQISS